MNRILLVALTLGVAVVVFGAATFLATSDVETPPPDAASFAEVALTSTDPAPSNDVLVRPHSPILGDFEAPVTIVEFFDPACEACRAFHPTVKSLLESNPDTVRLVIRYTPFHGKASEIAVALLEAARAQGLFEPVMDALLEKQGQWAAHGAPAADRALAIAEEAGVDMEKASAFMKSPMTIGILNADRADVQAVRIQGTPTFFINGRLLENFSREQLIAEVEREIEATRSN